MNICGEPGKFTQQGFSWHSALPRFSCWTERLPLAPSWASVLEMLFSLPLSVQRPLSSFLQATVVLQSFHTEPVESSRSRCSSKQLATFRDGLISRPRHVD